MRERTTRRARGRARTRHGRVPAAVLCAAVLVTGSAAPPARAAPLPPSASAVAGPGPVADGLPTIVDEAWVDDRTVDLELRSPAGGGPARVRLLLPDDWNREADRTWPVLYLLHGCCDDHTAWTDHTDVAELARAADLIVALPSGGPVGMYTDWWHYGRGGADWGRFTARELPDLLEAEFAAGGPRAIAGLSTGGHAALALAASDPGRYAAVAAFSPIAHTTLPGVPLLIQGMAVREGADPYALWGSPWSQADLWRANNPYENTEGLRGSAVYLSVGDGRPGPLDPEGAEGGELEAALAPTVYTLALRLRARGMPATTHFYGRGTHSWPYWERELHAAWPTLTEPLVQGG